MSEIPSAGIYEVQDVLVLPPGTGGVYQPHRTVLESRRLYVDGVLVALGPEAVDRYYAAHPELFATEAQAR